MADFCVGTYCNNLFTKGLCHFGAKHVRKFSGCKNQYLDIIIVVIYLFCSFCDDFDLCERCEQKPRQFVHDRKHLFIKLKRPAEQRVPKGRVLDDVCEPTCCIQTCPTISPPQVFIITDYPNFKVGWSSCGVNCCEICILFTLFPYNLKQTVQVLTSIGN